MNNSQSIERFRQYFSVIERCELSADQCKAAQLADGLISPKTTFFSNNREINPEIAGYGVLVNLLEICAQCLVGKATDWMKVQTLRNSATRRLRMVC